MYNYYKLFSLIIIFFLISNCSEKISYSGKMLNENNINYQDLRNTNEVIN